MPHRMFGRTRVAAVVACLALAGLALAARPGSARTDHDLDRVMDSVRAALGRQTGARAPGLVLSGSGRVEDIPIRMSFAWDGEGRFLRQIDGPGISTATGHDGVETWEQRPTGAVRLLELGDRSRALLLSWIVSGYWADPAAPFEIRLDSKRTKRRQVALELVLQGSNQTGTLWIDTADWLPRKMRILEHGREQELRFDVWQTVEPSPPGEGADAGAGAGAGAERAVPARMSMTDGGRDKVQLEFTPPVASHGFAHGYFGRRDDAARASFLPEHGTRLEVQRGRWGHLFVRGWVNGEDVGWMAFDTGASSTSVDDDVASRLDLTVIGETRSTGVGGQTRSTLVLADAVRVGPVELRSIPLVADDMARIDLGFGGKEVGLLGMDLLSRCVIVYDLATSSVWLHAPESYRLPAAGAWSPLLAYNNKPSVRLTYENREGLFSIDTGNPGGILFSPLTVKRFDLLAGRATRAVSVGGVGGSVAARRGTLQWVEWGSRRFEEVPADFVVDERGVVADSERDGVIGTDLLERYVVVFDMPNRRIAYLEHGSVEAQSPGAAPARSFSSASR